MLSRYSESCYYLMKLHMEVFRRWQHCICFTSVCLIYFIFDINECYFLRDLLSWSPVVSVLFCFFKLCYWNCAIVPELKHKRYLLTWELPRNPLTNKQTKKKTLGFFLWCTVIMKTLTLKKNMYSYGYRGRDCRANVYLLPTGEIVYFIASVVVLFNYEERTQRHYLGHTDCVKWLVYNICM